MVGDLAVNSKIADRAEITHIDGASISRWSCKSHKFIKVHQPFQVDVLKFKGFEIFLREVSFDTVVGSAIDFLRARIFLVGDETLEHLCNCVLIFFGLGGFYVLGIDDGLNVVAYLDRAHIGELALVGQFEDDSINLNLAGGNEFVIHHCLGVTDYFFGLRVPLLLGKRNAERVGRNFTVLGDVDAEGVTLSAFEHLAGVEVKFCCYHKA